MSNNASIEWPTDTSTESLIVAYYSLTLMIVGTFLNFLTFATLCRSKFRNTTARPTLHYMRAMAIFDILMLYGWNLDHYLSTVYEFHILRYSIVSCRFFSFLSYFAPQTSAWLRVLVCMDRYVSLSRLYRARFNNSTCILIMIGCIMLILALLNLHFLLFVCYHRSNGTISALSWLYNIYPLWDYVHLGVYNCAPFLLMVLFNSGVIYYLIQVRRTSTVQNSRNPHRAISITLVITTFLFLLMTVPATLVFAFFSSANTIILRVVDALLYSYHILSFPLYLITFDEFRREFLKMIECLRTNGRIIPLTGNLPRAWSKSPNTPHWMMSNSPSKRSFDGDRFLCVRVHFSRALVLKGLDFPPSIAHFFVVRFCWDSMSLVSRK